MVLGRGHIIFSTVEEVNVTMAKRNRQAGMNTAGVTAANAAEYNTNAEFATETNVAEVRRQNQQSANRAAQQAQQNNPTT